MTIKEKIQFDYDESIKLTHLKKNNEILGKIISQIENLTDEEIYDFLEEKINYLGKKIARIIKKSRLGEHKDIHFEQILYNSYLCTFKFKKKRSIYFEHNVEGALKANWDEYEEEKPLIFRI